MTPGCWYRISGDRPDLDLPPTPRGTRTLRDTDPAGDLEIRADQVNVKAKTAERLGAIGRGEGIAAEAIALIE